MKHFDYENGTAYIVLYKGDFVSESRFKAYADFMNQKGDIIRVPIDSERARNIRIPNCPLIPVPPHGRLIDADDFDKRIRLAGGMCEEELTEDFKDGIQTVLAMMKTQPTIIPAEKGE